MNGYTCKQCGEDLTGQRRKYCSDQCCNDFGVKPRGWIRKGVKERADLEERKRVYEYYASTMYTTLQAADILGMQIPGSVFARAKQVGVERLKQGTIAYWHKEDVQRMKELYSRIRKTISPMYQKVTSIEKTCAG